MLVAEKDGRFFKSKVYREGDYAIKAVWPKTPEAEDMLFREHDILLDFNSPHIVKAVDFKIHEGAYVLATEWVEQTPITDEEEFISGLYGVLAALDDAQVRHRDIRVKNIIPKNNIPVLIDFGWAHRVGETPGVPDSDLEHPDDHNAMQEIIDAWQSAHTPS